MTDSIIIKASFDDARLRYDQFLAKKLPQHSRSSLAKLIKNGAITKNGAVVKASQLIVGHEEFFLLMDKPVSKLITPQEIALDILYSDEHLAVINKAVGMVTHPGAGVTTATLCHALLFHFPDMVIGNVERPGIVHRLDRDTSGIMVVAKTADAHRHLSEDFKQRRVKKIYRAYCFGEFSESVFELKTGHVRHPFHRRKFFTKLSPAKVPSTNIRFAHTSFSVIKSRFGMSCLEATLHTGRTHQIRAHLADIDHPLLGDELYGKNGSLNRDAPAKLREALHSLKGQALHAHVLGFYHPTTQIFMEFCAPLPSHLALIDECLL